MSKFYNINHLGHIPFNPDLLLNKNRFLDRPVGFSFQEITKLYWTVKSFEVALTIVSFNELNALDSFLASGGTAGGAGVGLAVALNSIANQQPIILNGHTKIINRFERTVRKDTTNSSPFEGINNGSLQKKDLWFEKDPDNKIIKNPLTAIDIRPNEASLCSAGPVHTLKKGSAFLSIDFSDILFFKRLYWPKIQFLGSSNNLSFTFNPGPRRDVNVNVIGGVNFLGALLPFYGFAESFTAVPSRLVVAFGSISIGKRCCDRFFYDGFNTEREEDDSCKNVCGDGPNGVFENIKKV
jgi:hypothetical protein